MLSRSVIFIFTSLTGLTVSVVGSFCTICLLSLQFI
jgi:hypothetical protein